MEDTIRLQVITPSGVVYEGPVGYVQLPLEGGSVGVLANHAPLLGAVTEGVIRYTAGEERHYIAVARGVAQVEKNEVTVLAASAERAENIDLARAVASERRARERLQSYDEQVDAVRSEAALHRALARQMAVRLMNM